MTHHERLAPSGLLRGRLEHRDGRVELHLMGELDMGSAEGVRRRAAELAASTDGDLVLDLADLSFLGSSGVRALLQIHRALERDGRRLVVRNPQPIVRRIFEVTETDRLLTIESPPTAPASARPDGATMRPGDLATLTRRTPLAAGSHLWLDQGEQVTVVRVGERGCAVQVHGHTIVVPTDALRALGSRAPAPPGPAGDDDGWWDDVSGRLGDDAPEI